MKKNVEKQKFHIFKRDAARQENTHLKWINF